jgi:hypothetical protein
MAPQGGPANIVSVFTFNLHVFKHFESVTLATEGLGYRTLISYVDIYTESFMYHQRKKTKAYKIGVT